MAARVPSSKILPLLGWYNPVSSLIKVVFPGGFRKVFFQSLSWEKDVAGSSLSLIKQQQWPGGWFFCWNNLVTQICLLYFAKWQRHVSREHFWESCTHSQTNITFRGRTCSVQDLNSSPFLSPASFLGSGPMSSHYLMVAVQTNKNHH